MIKRTVSFALHQPLFLLMMTALFIGGGLMAFKSLPIIGPGLLAPLIPPP